MAKSLLPILLRPHIIMYNAFVVPHDLYKNRTKSLYYLPFDLLYDYENIIWTP